MTYSTTLTSKGQITIPVEIRRSLGLKTGESVRFKLGRDNEAILQKNDWKQGFDELHKKVAAHLKKRNLKPLADDKLEEAINRSSKRAAISRYRRSLE